MKLHPVRVLCILAFLVPLMGAVRILDPLSGPLSMGEYWPYGDVTPPYSNDDIVQLHYTNVGAGFNNADSLDIYAAWNHFNYEERDDEWWAEEGAQLNGPGTWSFTIKQYAWGGALLSSDTEGGPVNDGGGIP